MRSDTYLHPGENLNCIGCHEDKRNAPAIRRVPLALKRPPSRIKPEAPGTYPLSFPRLVQPILDKHPEFFAEIYPNQSLSGSEFGKWGWSKAMHTLSKDAWGKHGGNGALSKKNKRSYSLPMQEGARVSKLWKKTRSRRRTRRPARRRPPPHHPLARLQQQLLRGLPADRKTGARRNRSAQRRPPGMDRPAGTHQLTRDTDAWSQTPGIKPRSLPSGRGGHRRSS